MPQSHCAESTAERGWIDHSRPVGGPFLVILAMTMTMTINSNSVLLICVTWAGQHESFEHEFISVFCFRSSYLKHYKRWKQTDFRSWKEHILEICRGTFIFCWIGGGGLSEPLDPPSPDYVTEVLEKDNCHTLYCHNS